MNLKIKTFMIFIGDVVILYGSLIIALFLRRGFTPTVNFPEYVKLHLAPFSLFFIIWVLIFYLANLYDPRNFKNRLEFFKNFSLALIINGLAGVVFFYLFSVGGITPKTNLLLFLIVFATLGTLWRYLFNYLGGIVGTPEKILIIQSDSQNKLSEQLIKYLEKNRQLGYQITNVIKTENREIENIAEIIKERQIDLVIIPTHLEEKAKLASLIYENLSLGIKVLNFAEFYELIFKKVPLSELEEIWFLENFIKEQISYGSIKQVLERFLAFLLFIILSPLILIILIAVKLTSKGLAVYKQTRIGKKENKFTLYKFRTMYLDAEKHGPQWSGENDARITPIGKILRYTHLDELPQLVNIIKGDISFVGPRPERPEFVAILKEKIPYYEIRHLVEPGVTGWAQINYRYGSSIEDAYEKLQYDIYYLKNRSFVLDLLIILKTVKSIFVIAK
ncbi:MAG: sugar transferase [Patescibacteria group bacterium]|nr:sugar transferase [Patescibacteria group bacterium]